MGWSRCFFVVCWCASLGSRTLTYHDTLIHSNWMMMHGKMLPPVCFALNVTQLRLNKTGQDSNAQLSYRWVWYETREELGSAIGRRAKSSVKLVPTWRSARRPESKRGRIRRLKYSSRQCGEEWVEVGRYTYSAAGVLRWCGAGVGVWKALEGRES